MSSRPYLLLSSPRASLTSIDVVASPRGSPRGSSRARWFVAQSPSIPVPGMADFATTHFTGSLDDHKRIVRAYLFRYPLPSMDKSMAADWAQNPLVSTYSKADTVEQILVNSHEPGTFIREITSLLGISWEDILQAGRDEYHGQICEYLVGYQEQIMKKLVADPRSEAVAGHFNLVKLASNLADVSIEALLLGQVAEYGVDLASLRKDAMTFCLAMEIPAEPIETLLLSSTASAVMAASTGDGRLLCAPPRDVEADLNSFRELLSVGP